MNANHMINWSKTAAEIQDDYAAVCRQRDELLEALEAMRSACFDRRKANEEFERLGELYYREFGRLRPGKEDPLRDSCDEENTAQYNEWSRKRTEAALDLADAAIASVKAGCVSKTSESETQIGLPRADETQTSIPAIVFYPAGSLGEAVEEGS